MENVLKKGRSDRPAVNVKRKNLKRKIWNGRQYYLLILPAILYVVIFCYGPMYGLQIAFKNFKFSLGFAGSRWVGFQHFIDFFQGYYFITLLKNTLLLSLYGILIGFPIPIVIALILNELHGRFKKTVQTILYAPHFISIVVLVGMVNMLFSPTTGIVNHFLNTLGIESIYFLGRPEWFRPLFIGSGVWQSMGWNAIVYIAALAGVDPALHEAASIDGASRFQKIIHINLPTIMPTIIIMFIMKLGQIASVAYEKAYLMQNDLNISVSAVISTYVYERGLVNNNYSFATAVGLFNNLVNIVMLLLANFISKKVSQQSLF